MVWRRLWTLRSPEESLILSWYDSRRTRYCLSFKSNRFVITIFDFHCHGFCRNLAKQTLCTIQWIYNVQSTTCLVLVLTLRPQRYAGVFCSWPNTLKYKVWLQMPILMHTFEHWKKKILLKHFSLLLFTTSKGEKNHCLQWTKSPQS